MMKGRLSPMLVIVGLLFLGGWSVRAEPPVTLGTDEITQEDAALGTDEIEQEIQEDHEAVHQHDTAEHEHGADTPQHDADTHQHDSGTGEHTQGSEGMGDHSRMHDMGRMGDGTKGDHGGRMHGGH